MNALSRFVLASLASTFVACQDAPEPSAPLLRSVRYVEVSDHSGPVTRTLSGQVQASNNSRLSFQVAGRVERVNVKVGDRVRAGTLLAALDPTDFQLQLQEAQASLQQVQAMARSAQSTYTRIRALYENKNASTQDLDNAKAQRDSSSSSVAAAAQAVRRLKRQLSYATIAAPSDGTVREVAIDPNEIVGAGQVVIMLQAGTDLEISVDVPESLVNRIKRNQEVSCRIPTLKREEFPGTVNEIGIPGAYSAAYPVTVRISEPTPGVENGMAAEVTFSLPASEGGGSGIRVPTTAVSEDREGRFVYLVDAIDDGTGVVRRVTVQVGSVENDGIEVEKGLSPGEKVVTAGVSRIYDGLKVKVPKQEASSL